jgi:phospholipase C
MDDFKADAAAGTLPPVVFVDATFTSVDDPGGDTEHPPGDIQIGQAFTSDVVHTLFASPQWSKLAFFIMYDEHGGIYDHVPPPSACVPDSKPLLGPNDTPVSGAFDRYGFRVPLMVVSPYAKRGWVSHEVYDHTSILRLIQAKHTLPALTARDANAMIPIDFFDFASSPNLVPPSLPAPGTDRAELDYCVRTYTK